jgi:hypothetical protein
MQALPDTLAAVAGENVTFSPTVRQTAPARAVLAAVDVGG